MLNRQVRNISILLLILDTTMLVVCFVAAFYLKKYFILPDPNLKLTLYLELLVVELPFLLLVLALSGVYRSRNLVTSLSHQSMLILRATLYIVAVFLTVSFYAKMFSYSRAIFMLFFILIPVGLISLRQIFFLIRHRSGNNHRWINRILFFGESHLSVELEKNLKSNPYFTFVIRKVQGQQSFNSSLSDNLELISQGEIDSVFIDLPIEEIQNIVKIIQKTEKEGVSVYVSPRVIPTTLLNPSLEMMGNIPLIVIHPQDLPLIGKIVKTTMDLTLSFLAVILLSPLLVLIALLIKITSTGPVLYKQLRVGLDGKEFMIFKFRSMRKDAESRGEPVWATQDDDRVTRIGSILRRTNLDELPQLFNVLTNTMSLVGPRPERPHFVNKFKDEIERYAHKHWVKPGITGWAQVNGWRGDTDIEERIRHDIYYIENWSLWMDVKILFMTLVRGSSSAL